MRAKIEGLKDRIRNLKEIETVLIRYGEDGIRREVLRTIKGCEGELRVLQTRTQQKIPIVI